MSRNRSQLVIETDLETRQKIKLAALLAGKTMREWVLEACEEKLQREKTKQS